MKTEEILSLPQFDGLTIKELVFEADEVDSFVLPGFLSTGGQDRTIARYTYCNFVFYVDITDFSNMHIVKAEELKDSKSDIYE